MSLYTVIILYTIRAVTSVFTPSDMKKNPVTAERYQSGRGRLCAKSLIWNPRVVNAVTMMQNKSENQLDFVNQYLKTQVIKCMG